MEDNLVRSLNYPPRESRLLNKDGTLKFLPRLSICGLVLTGFALLFVAHQWYR